MIPRKTRAIIARENSETAKWMRVHFKDNRVPETKGVFTAKGSWDCWCGEPRGHEWPGCEDGAPHPR